MNYMPDYLQAEYKKFSGKADYEKLVQFARTAIATHPDDKEYLYAYIAIYLKFLNKYDECIAHCISVMPEMKNKECIKEVMRFMAYAQEEAGNKAQAIETRKKIVAENTNDSSELSDLAELYEKANDMENAVACYEKLDAMNRLDFDEYQKISNYYDGKKEYANARKYYEKAALADPDNGQWAWCNIGRTFALENNEEEARFYFKMAMKLDPEYEWPHYFLGIISANRNDYYMALHHYNQALKLKPDFPEVLNNIAAMKFNDEGDVAEAIELMLKALEGKPEGPIVSTLYLNLARMYKKIADYDNHQYYKGKLLESLGFPIEFREEDDDDEGDVLK